MSDFWKRKIKGVIAKQFVYELFEESGFEVCPVGYESLFSTIKNKIRNNDDKMSLQIRTIPDVLAINKRTNQLHLLEVKFRSYPGKIDIKERELSNYQALWPEAFIICVIPDEIGFYAQKIANIKPEGKVTLLGGERVIALNIKNNFMPIWQFGEFAGLNKKIMGEMIGMIKQINQFDKH